MKARLLTALFALGGVSALVYEVLWMRSFRLVFGSSTRSAAAVLAAYFAGMAIGSLIGARLARRRDPIRLYGLAELAVGLSALAVAPWLGLFHALYPKLYALADGDLAGLTLGRLALALVALGPPTLAMGATLPLVARALVERADRVAQQTGRLYAWNVAGATAGALLAAFALPTTLGVRGGVLLAVALNLAIGVCALWLARRYPTAAPTEMPTPAAPLRPPAGLLAAAALSGFGVLALEVLFFRLLSQRGEGSVYSFGLMLAIFLVFLALGAAWVARRLDRGDAWRFLAWTQTGAFLAILLAPLLFQLVPLLTLYSPRDSLELRLARLALGGVLVLGLPVTLVGVVLPATWKLAARDVEGVGRQVGLLAATSTLAGVAGSLVAGFVLLPRLGLGRSLLGVAGLYALLAIACHVKAQRGVWRALVPAGCAALALLAAALGTWRTPLQPLGEGDRLIRYRDGETATLAVVQTAEGERKLELDHNYLLGSSAAAPREVRQGRLPLLLHPRPRRVAFIGVATGLTASAVLDFPVERAVALEIVPGVLDALPDFGPWNRDFFRDERVELVVADGRNYLLGTAERFDVVVGDLFVPWHAGTGDLYSLEHFETVAQRLAPGGLFLQWLPGYQLSLEELRTIAASLLAAFPDVTLWRNDFDADQPLVAFVGRNEPASLDPAAIRSACASLASAAGPPATFLSDPAGLALLYVADDAALREWARGAALNRDDHPVIEYATPRSAFEHRQREVASLHDLLAGFGPRRWCCGEWIAERPAEEVFAAADLLQEAVLAHTRHHFEREHRALARLAESAGALPGVGEEIVVASRRYRSRGMRERAAALLGSLAKHADPPLAALVELADDRLAADDAPGAIALLERSVERAPGRPELRRKLVELLEREERFAPAERELRRLLEASPDDAFLRVDLAHALHRQGKRAAAADEIARVRERSDLEEPRAVWAHLQRRGLSDYLDAGATRGAPNGPGAE